MKPITIDSPHSQQDQRDLTPFKIGEYSIIRRALQGTPRTVYCVMYGERVAGKQLSYPTQDDCRLLTDAYERANGRKFRVPKFSDATVGTLAERVVVMLKMNKHRMSGKDLTATMKCSADALSPVLNRLVRGMRVRRSGEKGNWMYTAA